MTLPSITGLDHVVVTTHDLAAAAEGWRRLGFTLSPRGTHSAHLGTGNHTIMLGPDYIELLGVLAETAHNEPTRAFLRRHGEGLERIAFTTTEAEAGAAALRERGLAATGPLDFGRPVALPGGGETEARFRTFFWPLDAAPAGVRLFACEHLTREAVWIPSLQQHANTARRIKRVEMIARDPEAAARRFAELTAAAAARDRDAWRIETGADRAEVAFLDRAALQSRHPKVPLDGLGDEGGAALVLQVEDLDAAARALGAAAIGSDAGVAAPPAAANGLVLRFEA